MKDNPGPYERMRRQVVTLVAWLIVIAAALGGLIALGRWARDELRADERFRVNFEDIDCESPPGLKRAEFLGQVQYNARLPNRVSFAEGGPIDVLRDAFLKHPWVTEVNEIEPRPPGRLRVRLTFRTPALAVPWDGGIRVVDDQGILLPETTPAKGLRIFTGMPAPPGESWKAWPDADVVKQASGRPLSPS